MKDPIERQAAIDELEKWIYDGADTRTIAEVIGTLPSTQPKVNKCGTCKYYKGHWYCEAWNNSPGFPAVDADMYCSMWEERSEGR